MGHFIQAIVGRPDTLREVRTRAESARLVSLDQGFAMIPATEGVLDQIYGPSEERSESVPGFTYLAPNLVRLLQEMSRRGPIAYVETEYFGGVGEQAAAAYLDGKTAMTEAGTQHPINQALRLIGVVRNAAHDEFDAIGLGRYRNMDEWEKQGQDL